MLTVTIENEQIRIGERFSFSMYRTLRVPDDGLDRPLPAGLGALPVHRASDYPGRVPPAWRRSEDLFSPLHRWESLWIGFRAAAWKPNAVKVAVGGISAITGASEDGRLRDDPQDYLVCPPQPWLDGVNLGGGVVRQFVSAPIGAGETVEARLTGREVVGGLRVTVFEPRPGLFPDRPPEPCSSYEELPAQTAGTLGLGAGGRLRQKIYPDPYGLAAWDQGNLGTVVVHLVTAGDYQALTGREPPPSPITAETYARQGLPWFELDDRDRGTLGSTSALTNVRPIHESGVAPGKGGQPAGPASETGGPAPAETLTPESTAPLSESEDLISPTP